MTHSDGNHVIVVGGGIAGLTAAYRLRQRAPALAVTLVEREGRLGGKLLTERHAGFVIEAAPDSMLSNKPPGVGLVEELGLAERLHGQRMERRKTYVRHGGALHRLPEGLTGLIPTNLEALAASSLLSAEGRARVAQEPDVAPREDGGDESIAAFITRRLGREAFERLVEPLMGGIYAGDARRLSVLATFPQLRRIEREHGSLIRGLQARQPAASAPPRYPPFVSFPLGMGELAEALAQRLEGVDLRLGRAVEHVAPEGAGYALALDDGSRLAAQALIVATPAYVTARLLAFDQELAAAHAAIAYASTAIVTLAYDEASLEHDLEGFGYVIPRVEESPILACTWSSSKWAGRAPAGQALIRVYIGRHGLDELATAPEETLVAHARAELQATLGVEQEPRLVRVHRWPRSMPQYNLGHVERLALITRQLDQRPGLFLAGAAYRGVGIPDCIHSGDLAAQAALGYLKDGA